MRCVNIGARAVPDSALGTVILDSGAPDLQGGEVTASRNITKESGAEAPQRFLKDE